MQANPSAPGQREKGGRGGRKGGSCSRGSAHLRPTAEHRATEWRLRDPQLQGSWIRGKGGGAAIKVIRFELDYPLNSMTHGSTHHPENRSSKVPRGHKDLLGRLLALFGPLWAPLGPLWAPLGPLCAPLGPLWAPLAPL